MADIPPLVLTDSPSEGVARLRLNRPEARNALNTPLRAALVEAFRKIEDDDGVRCAIVCGSSTCFAAGADLKKIVDFGPADVWRLGVQRFWKVISGFSRSERRHDRRSPNAARQNSPAGEHQSELQHT